MPFSWQREEQIIELSIIGIKNHNKYLSSDMKVLKGGNNKRNNNEKENNNEKDNNNIKDNSMDIVEE